MSAILKVPTPVKRTLPKMGRIFIANAMARVLETSIHHHPSEISVHSSATDCGGNCFRVSAAKGRALLGRCVSFIALVRNDLHDVSHFVRSARRRVTCQNDADHTFLDRHLFTNMELGFVRPALDRVVRRRFLHLFHSGARRHPRHRGWRNGGRGLRLLSKQPCEARGYGTSGIISKSIRPAFTNGRPARWDRGSSALGAGSTCDPIDLFTISITVSTNGQNTRMQ